MEAVNAATPAHNSQRVNLSLYLWVPSVDIQSLCGGIRLQPRAALLFPSIKAHAFSSGCQRLFQAEEVYLITRTEIIRTGIARTLTTSGNSLIKKSPNGYFLCPKRRRLRNRLAAFFAASYANGFRRFTNEVGLVCSVPGGRFGAIISAS